MTEWVGTPTNQFALMKRLRSRYVSIFVLIIPSKVITVDVTLETSIFAPT